MLYSRFKLSQEHYALLSARTQESISGIKVVKSFTQEDNEINTFADLNREYINKNMALARVRSIFWPLMILVGGIGSLVVLIIGGFQVINGLSYDWPVCPVQRLYNSFGMAPYVPWLGHQPYPEG